MIGFVLLILMVVAGSLVLIKGLQILGVVGTADPATLSGVSRAELERIHDTLSALESRLDTLQDEQRFLERLLAERGDAGSLSPGRGADADSTPSILFDTRER